MVNNFLMRMRSLLCHPKSERDRSRWPRLLWDALEALIARLHRKPPNCKPPRVLHEEMSRQLTEAADGVCPECAALENC
jgi:hypothetical protein